MPFVYKDIRMETGFRIEVVLEIKPIDPLAPVHFAQTLPYLRLSNLKLALLINFKVKSLKEGIHRIVNQL